MAETTWQLIGMNMLRSFQHPITMHISNYDKLQNKLQKALHFCVCVCAHFHEGGPKNPLGRAMCIAE